MLSLDLIRKEPETVRQGLANRGEDPAVVAQVLDLDTRRRTTVTERDRLRAQQNEASRRLLLSFRAERGISPDCSAYTLRVR